MKTIFRALAIGSALIGAPALAGQLKPAPRNAIPDEYIVVVHPNATPANVAAWHGISRRFTYSKALNGFAGKIPPGLLQQVVNDPAVLYVQQDGEARLAKRGGKPGGGDPPALPMPEVMEWGVGRVNGGVDATGRVAWIVDSGIDLDHLDLNVDAGRGFSAFTKGKDAGMDDGDGHGTHVAGIIAAKSGNGGVIGVAANATVVPVKVLNSRGSGSWSGVIAGIDHVATYGRPGDVANLSLGGGVVEAVDSAVVNAAAGGIRFVLAAGNESDDVRNHSPGRANGPNVFTVSAIDINDVFASFSNYGPGIDYAAPGVAIRSTYKGGGYATLSGTSMAAPHVAGILLLGPIQPDGFAQGDPDGAPDPIAVH